MRKVDRSKFTEWKPIETVVTGYDIWVLKYDMWQKDGVFVAKNTPGAEKLTSCHGYYVCEADALKVQRHFPNPSAYRLEKVMLRELK